MTSAFHDPSKRLSQLEGGLAEGWAEVVLDDLVVPLRIDPVTIAWPASWARSRAARLPGGSSVCDPGNEM
mgnify:CR=1 FL=1